MRGMTTSADRAVVLAGIADEFMHSAYLPLSWHIDPDMRSLRAETYPPGADVPYEVRFVAEWPDITLVAARPLAGYSLEGGLHRIGAAP